MTPCAVIVAGGRSARMGREKALAPVRGRMIIARIATVLAPQVQSIVINAHGDAQRFTELGFQVVPDLRQEVGTPLAGVHAALVHARNMGCDSVVTTPSDTPFLPADLVLRLAAAKQPAAIAASGGQPHYLTGLWAVALLPDVERAMDEPRLPRLQDWCRMSGAAVVEWPVQPYDPFFNVNTPSELAEAERIAAELAL